MQNPENKKGKKRKETLKTNKRKQEFMGLTVAYLIDKLFRNIF